MAKVAVYNVTCRSCGLIWQPGIGTPLWWKAKKHAEGGYLDAVNVSAEECGCQEASVEPDAPYRVTGYDDMCVDFDVPYYSLVAAAQKYLELARDSMYVVFFVDRRADELGITSRVQTRLRELV